MSQILAKKILIVRNDKLGDFMLSFPCYALLKKAMPNCEIVVLVPHYTEPLAAECHWIDRIIIDPGPKGPLNAQLKLIRQLKSEKFDTLITLFSTTRIGLLAFLANIKYRLAPATKIAQLFYNHRLKQHRSRSEAPEYKYNLYLIHHFLKHLNISPIPPLAPPYLQFDKNEINQLRSAFCHQHHINNDKPILFIHSGSGGSANNLSVQQYAELAIGLHKQAEYQIVLTAGPDELEQTQHLSSLLSTTPNTIYHSTRGLVEFAKHIQFADLFISGSTGPLHIAGALDTPTVAFYPRRRSATKLRWQTLNSEPRRLSFSPPESSQDTGIENDMDSINIEAVINKICSYFFNSQHAG